MPVTHITRSTAPDLLPGSIVTNGCQKYMDADRNCYTNQKEHAKGDQQNAEAFLSATGDEHSGVTVSHAAVLRNITGRGYAGVNDLI